MEGEIRKVERRARRLGAAHLGERGAEFLGGLAEPALGRVGARQVVHRRQQQLGVARGTEQRAYLVQHRDRRLVLAEVEVRARLHLEQPRARLEPEVVGHREPALGHAEHLLVAPAQVEHLAEPDQGEALVEPVPRRALSPSPTAVDSALV